MPVLSAACAVGAFVASTLVHELAHAAVMLAQGSSTVEVHQLSATSSGPTTSTAVSIAAGPIVSLILGAVAHTGLRRLDPVRHAAASLALAWLVVVAWSYVAVAVALSVYAGSDLGKLLATAHAPGWLAVALVPVGMALLVYGVGRIARTEFERIAGSRAPLIAAVGWVAVVLTHAPLLSSRDLASVVLLALSAAWQVAAPSQHPERTPARTHEASSRSAVKAVIFAIALLAVAVAAHAGIVLG
jgi:hypothetical protein